jgi:hypothetical protein
MRVHAEIIAGRLESLVTPALAGRLLSLAYVRQKLAPLMVIGRQRLKRALKQIPCRSQPALGKI